MSGSARQTRLEEKRLAMLVYENRLRQTGLCHIAGVDEVGRGPLAGPVVAAAVILPEDFPVLGVDDSKKLSPKKRDELYDQILEMVVACGIGQVDHATIDRINILEATKAAMLAALAELAGNLSAVRSTGQIEHVLVDALTLPGLRYPQTAIIRGDGLSLSIAAASIVAKVTRDRQMEAFHESYPEYGFDRNKGYGTAEHYRGLKQVGLCPIHRRSFLSRWAEDSAGRAELASGVRAPGGGYPDR